MAFNRHHHPPARQHSHTVLGAGSSHSCLDGIPFKISPVFRPLPQPGLPPELFDGVPRSAFHQEYDYETEEGVLAWAQAREEAKLRAQQAERERAERARQAVAAAAESSSSSEESEDEYGLVASQTPGGGGGGGAAKNKKKTPPPSQQQQQQQASSSRPPWQLPLAASVGSSILTPVPIQTSKAKAQSPMGVASSRVDLALFEQEGDPFDNLELQTLNDMEELRTLLELVSTSEPSQALPGGDEEDGQPMYTNTEMVTSQHGEGGGGLTTTTTAAAADASGSSEAGSSSSASASAAAARDKIYVNVMVKSCTEGSGSAANSSQAEGSRGMARSLEGKSAMTRSTTDVVRSCDARSALIRSTDSGLAFSPPRSADARSAMVRSTDDRSALARSSDSRSPLVRSSGERSAMARSTDDRSALARSTDDKSALARSTDDRSALARSTDDRSALARSTDDRSALARSTDDRSALARSTDDRSALARSTDDRSALARSADDRYAVVRSADDRSALARSTDDRSVLVRSADDRYAVVRSTDDRSALVRSTNERSALARSTDDRYAVVRSTDDRSALAKSTDDRPALVRSMDAGSALIRSSTESAPALEGSNLSGSVHSKPDRTSKTSGDFVIEPTGDGDYVMIRSDYSQKSVTSQQDIPSLYANLGGSGTDIVDPEPQEEESQELYTNSQVFTPSQASVKRRVRKLFGDQQPTASGAVEKRSSIAGSSSEKRSSVVFNPIVTYTLPRSGGHAEVMDSRMTQSAYGWSDSPEAWSLDVEPASGDGDAGGGGGSAESHTYTNVPFTDSGSVMVASTPAFPCYTNSETRTQAMSMSCYANSEARTEAMSMSMDQVRSCTADDRPIFSHAALAKDNVYSNMPCAEGTSAEVNSIMTASMPAFSDNFYGNCPQQDSDVPSPGNIMSPSSGGALRNARSDFDLSIHSPQPWNPYKPLPPPPVSEARSSSSSTESLPTEPSQNPSPMVLSPSPGEFGAAAAARLLGEENDPFLRLSTDARSFVFKLTSMGFSRSRVSRAVEKFGSDEKDVLDHLFNVDKLVEKKFNPSLAELSLQLFKNDIRKAEQFLDLFQQFRELGFASERIQTALVKHELDRDKALDYLTT